MLAGLRWRGSWTAAPGGVAAVSNSGEKFLLPPSPSFCFLFSVAVCSRFGFGFWFRFPSSRFVSVLLSLSGLTSLLPLSSGLLLFFFLFSALFLPIYRKQNGAGTTFVCAFNHATAGRPLTRSVVVGARRERGGTVFKNFRLLFAVNSEGRRKMNNVVQNDTVLATFDFFFFIYIYKTASF